MSFFSKFVGLVALYFATARLGLKIDSVNGFAALVWPPTGIAICAVLLGGYRYCFAIAIGAFLVNYSLGAPVFSALGIGFGNSFEAALATYLLHRVGFHPKLDRVKDISYLVFLGAGVSCFVGAVIGASSLQLAQMTPTHTFFKTWLTWWIGDANGCILLVPFIMSWVHEPKYDQSPVNKSEIMGLTAATFLLAFLVFRDPIPNLTLIPWNGPYLIFPCFIWATFRFGLRGITSIVLLVATVAIWAASHDAGPFPATSATGRLLALQIYLGISAITSLILSAIISERRRIKEELLIAKESAEIASKAKSTFLANMSHEIRTPLGAMLGYTDFLLDPNQSQSDRMSCAATIKKNGDLLKRVIDDILDLSKVEANRLTFEKVKFSLTDLLQDVCSLLSFRASEKGIAFEVIHERPLPAFIKSDPIRIKQILLNVIGNAIKFTEHGHVKVKVDYQSLAPGDGISVEFWVEDSGVGLSSEQSKLLFQPFAQADNTTSRRFGGTGLGLFLSQKLARGLGGDLKLHNSIPGMGSVFTFSFHAEIVDSADVRKVIVPQKSPPDRLKGFNVLIVEDALDNQILISRYLELAGAKVVTADNGREGIHKALEGAFNVVLMDIQMPGLDGYLATSNLRTQGFIKPIIALTAHAMSEEREKALRVGFNDYLTKPVSQDNLINLVWQWGNL